MKVDIPAKRVEVGCVEVGCDESRAIVGQRAQDAVVIPRMLQSSRLLVIT